jgi:lauroyl/myristoyl acyltransferase
VHWFFRCAELYAAFSIFLPHQRKMIRFLSRAAREKEQSMRVREIGRRHLVYRKWLKYLVYGWPNWMDRVDEWSRLEGDEHLQTALKEGRGALLLSGHRFGFDRLVAPVLALRGHAITRTGKGPNAARRVSKWGKGDHIPWRYVNYGNDYWTHLKALRQMGQTLARNEVLHLSIRTQRSGPAGGEIRVFGQQFWLDPAMLEVIEILQAPVLPCFCMPADKGKLLIRIHPQIHPSRPAILSSFVPLYTDYLHTFPELSRIWKRMGLGWEAW